MLLIASFALLVLGCADRRTPQGIVIPQDWGVDRGEMSPFFLESDVESFPIVFAEDSGGHHDRGSRLIVFGGDGRMAMKAAPFDIEAASTAQLANWINDPSYYYAGIHYRTASGGGRLRLFRPTPAGYKVHEYALSLTDDGRALTVQSGVPGKDNKMEMRLIQMTGAAGEYVVTGPELVW